MTGKTSIIVPEASTNNVLNPVAGTTGNFAALAGATVTRVTTYAYLGGWSYRVQTAADTDGINLTLNALANAIHYATARVRGTLPAGFQWTVDNATWSTPTLLATEGDWSVYGVSFPAAQCNGSTFIYLQQIGAGSGDFYVGHVQVEQKEYATRPIIGDLPGCEWNGTDHGSTSTRSAQSRSGGREYNLDDLGLYIKDYEGLGMPPLAHRANLRSLLPGAEYAGQKTLPRQFLLTGEIISTSMGNLHSLRKTLLNAMKPDRVKGDQEFLLRYTGANGDKPVQIACVLDVEEGIINVPSNQRLVLRLIANDPFFYEDANGMAALTTSQGVANADYAVRKTDGDWANISTDFTGYPEAIVEGLDRSIYMGGDFTNVGDSDGDYIVKWTPSTAALSSLGTGMNGAVRALAVAPDGSIYAGGAFTLAGGVANTVRIAKWNGSAWTPLSTGIGSGAVYAIAIGLDGKVYIGGSFTNHGDDNGDYITSWDGSAWASLGTGMNSTVYALAIAPNGDLIAAGIFTTAGGTTVNGIARWNGSAWSALSTGVSGGDADVYALAIDKAGNIYIGGDFTAAGGVSCANIAKWNGSIWSPLGSGTDNDVTIMTMDKNGLLYVGGLFTTAGGLSLASGFGLWNGATWAHVDSLVSAVDGILCAGDDLYVGFSGSGTLTTSEKNTITNSGTTRAYPKFVFKRSGGTSAVVEYLKNETTGATLWFNYSLLDGETLTIDFTPGKRSIRSSIFGDVWRALLRNSDFADFYLLPGSNDVSVFISNNGSTLTAYATWPVTHWSADGAAT